MLDVNELILLVQKNVDGGFILQSQLRRWGIHNPIYTLQRAEEAIEFLSSVDPRHHPDAVVPRVIILNLEEEAEGGFPLLSYVRSMAPLPRPVLIGFANHRSPGTLQTALDLGVNAFVNQETEWHPLAEVLQSLEFDEELAAREAAASWSTY